MQQSFLQSHEWEKLQAILGRKSWRIAGHLVIQHDLVGGFNYLYAPHLSELTDEFLRKVRALALKERAIFLKIDPYVDRGHWKLNIKGSQFSHFIQPQKTVIVDLKKPEEEMLAGMHSKTRYNIRLAERKGVNVVNCGKESLNFVDAFWKLLSDTAKRDSFHPHPKYYYEKLLGVRGNAFSNTLFFAEWRGIMLAAALVNYCGNRVTYLHGASSNLHREKMAPFLLHWRIMQDAKKRGFHFYDFWGIDEKKWPGVSRFKIGFGGETVEYPRSIDIVFRPVWYRAYKIARNIL